jgi:hypothetical protein
MKLNIDVIHINGLLHKINKFWRIHLFCNESHIREADFWVLVTTNTANIGIDKLSIALQMRFDWPCDLLTYFQEQGRGSQQNGSKSICMLYANLSSYVSLVSQIVGVADCTDEETRTSEYDGYNSAISPRCQVPQANTSQFDFALGPLARRQLHVCTWDELHQVVQFFCLDLCCQHVWGELFLSSGLLDSILATGCYGTCPMCIWIYCCAHGNNLFGQWKKYICIRWTHRTDEFIYMSSYMWIHLWWIHVESI